MVNKACKHEGKIACKHEISHISCWYFLIYSLIWHLRLVIKSLLGIQLNVVFEKVDCILPLKVFGVSEIGRCS